MIDEGVKKILLCAGGSATCDGGTGIFSALGMKFIDADGKCFIPVGGTLNLITEVCMSEFTSPIPEIIVLSDVSNQLLGPNGAARVYAPQKGASEEEVEILEKGLTHFCEIMDGNDISQNPGMGAAGGAPFGLSIIGAKEVRPQVVGGAKFIMELVNFKSKACDADFIITGKGEITENTKYGKVVWEMMRFGKLHKIPLIAITGKVERSDVAERLYNQGLTKVFILSNDTISRKYSISHTPELLQNTAEKIGKKLFKREISDSRGQVKFSGRIKSHRVKEADIL